MDMDKLECDLYVMTRWMRLSHRAKLLLGLYDSCKAELTFMIWRKEWLERRNG